MRRFIEGADREQSSYFQSAWKTGFARTIRFV